MPPHRRHLPGWVADSHLIKADVSQIEQVFVNLVANAHQAMRRQARPKRITVTGLHDAAMGRVYVDVTDTGPGGVTDTGTGSGG